MGWVGDEYDCPNPDCNNSKAKAMFHNDLHGPFYLLCDKCGFCMLCNSKAYIIDVAVIDKSIVDQNIRDMDWEVLDKILKKYEGQNILDSNLF